MRIYKVLVIGCGNIGAQYDRYTDEIQTHVKAWYLNPLTDVYIYDLNNMLAQEIADQYQCKIIDSIDTTALADFDCISICTPTSTHLELLEKSLAANVNTIICEKPISNNPKELEHLKQLYLEGNSNVLVNYIRRFLPAFSDLRALIASFSDKEILTNISVRYQKGFINNCSHALDLLEYLFNSEITLKDIKIHNEIFDHFNDDATLSLQAIWGDVNFNIQGLTNVLFSQFEIDLYFKRHKISIKNSGDIIEVYKLEEEQGVLKQLIMQIDLKRTDCLKNYMRFVTDHAVNLINGSISNDNFLNSLDLNRKILKYKKN